MVVGEHGLGHQKLAFAVVHVHGGTLDGLFLVSVPDEEANGELAFHVVEGVGRNQKISTGLRPEHLAELTEVGCLHNFQL